MKNFLLLSGKKKNPECFFHLLTGGCVQRAVTKSNFSLFLGGDGMIYLAGERSSERLVIKLTETDGRTGDD